MSNTLSGPTLAEQEAQAVQHDIQIKVRAAARNFLEIGRLLSLARQDAHWTILHYESFRDYVEELRLPSANSYSWAMQLIGIHEELVLKRGLDADRLMEIGMSKLSRLLPAARADKLTPEQIDQAEQLTDRDLRIELGQHVVENDAQAQITCTRCGEILYGCRWVKKAKP